ncbi:ribonuclease III [Phaeocystis globosa virus 12T]|uniref:Ribonuclease III n=1 Tax=Phaeocystis globosa virus PgV-16T TaxID=3071227 RepID=A0AC59EXF0_9VIRU|nr:ribonuclease III [Phaeocystis globosa virus]AET73170.1 ribonuclease III [Phaeocystis globosa virus 12T]AET73994.1 ribonuclease III [Phaeocystis globosa virus 14T]AGM15631.1 ribonuclease III [Phaeocystis globosa virus PgV-16T]UYE94361.1 ribonuclease III [Phaeocystis globosa virus]
MFKTMAKPNLCLKDNNTDDESDTEPNNITTDDNIISSDELVFNPYNSLNKEIQVSNVQELLNTYGILAKPHNLELYKRAFIHRSYTKKSKIENELANINIAEYPTDCLPLKTKSNERLEFIGDGVLELVTKYYLYKRFPKADEGFMTEKKIALVKNEHIGKLAYEMGLHKYYIISRHAEEKNVRTNLKKLGCLFEAFIGAMFLDYNRLDIKDEAGWFENVFNCGPGLQMAQIFIEHVFEKHVDWTQLIANDDNYKNQLQVIIQKEFKLTPEYVELHNHNDNDTDNKTYIMGLYICFGQNIHKANIKNAVLFDDLKSFKEIHTLVEQNPKLLVFITKASHKIKKKAEQFACENAIKLIKELNNNNDKNKF